MSITASKSTDPAIANDLASHDLRTIVKNLMIRDLAFPDLEMENRTVPDLHDRHDALQLAKRAA